MKIPEQVVNELNALEAKMSGYAHALAVVSWDGATFAPKKSVNDRAQALGMLGGELFKLSVGEEMDELLSAIELNPDDYDEKVKLRAKLLRRDYKRTKSIPVEEYMEFMTLRSMSGAAWEKAKEEDNYEHFAPFLGKVIAFNKKLCKYIAPDAPVYNTLLDEYERGLTTETLDVFFEELKNELVPLIKMVTTSDKRDEIEALNSKFLSKHFDADTQKLLTADLCDAINIDRDRCNFAVSMHPFTSSTHRDNARFTTVYEENNLLMSVFSSMHEGGHAKYEMGFDPEDDYTTLSDAASMAMHESQSRFYENNIGRSEEYSKVLYDIVVKRFPEQMAEFSSEDFFKIANRSTPSLIRVQADELTYCLHIMVRYEMEKLMYSTEVDVNDLPRLWNEKYEQYLGITPPNNAIGVMQDVHWSEGLMGYFPSYALGSAYAAQFEAAIKREMDFDSIVKDGDLSKIDEWMSTRVHMAGNKKTPAQIIEDATGEKFTAKYYVEYLKNKYTKIYG